MINHSRRGRGWTLKIAASIAATALVVTACGRSDDPSDSAGNSIDDSPATGIIEFWAGGPDGQQLPTLLEDFYRENPDVKVNFTEIPNEEFDAKLIAAITAGTVPDMVFLYNQTMPGMLATDGFAAVPDGLVNPADFFESAYSSTLQDGTSHAVPWYTYADVMTYRKDIADQAGVKAPTTWDELKTFSAALQEEGVEHAWGLEVGYSTYTALSLEVLCAQNGSSLIAKDLKSWTINTPECVEALEFWGSLFTEGYSSPDGPGFLDTVSYFTEGKIAAAIQGPWFPGWLDEANGEGWSAEHIATAVPAAGPGGIATSVAGGSLAVLKGAKNAEASWKLARWMTRPEVQADWYGIFRNLPAVVKAWDDPRIADDELLTAVKEALPYGVPAPPAPAWGEVSAIISQGMESVARGTATAQEALDAAQQQATTVGTGIQ